MREVADEPEIVAIPCMTCNGTGVILVPVGLDCGYGSIMCMDCLGMRELYRVINTGESQQQAGEQWRHE